MLDGSRQTSCGHSSEMEYTRLAVDVQERRHLSTMPPCWKRRHPPEEVQPERYPEQWSRKGGLRNLVALVESRIPRSAVAGT